MKSLISIIIIGFSQIVFGAGGDDYSDLKQNDVFEEPKSLISNDSYSLAYEKLVKIGKRYKKQEEADRQNLLGFTARKQKNFKVAAAHYQKALLIDPKHKDALEYQGELFLSMGLVENAKENLRKLKKICWNKCDQVKDLESAIANIE